MLRKPLRVCTLSVIAAAVATAAVAAGTVAQAGTAAVGTAAQAAQSAHVGGRSFFLAGSPGNPVVNAKTHTLYGLVQSSDVLDVIDTSTCAATAHSHCRVVAKIRAGKTPLAAAIDERTDTIYVANGSGGISVVDGSRCNAVVRAGCGRAPVRIRTGGFDVADVLDPRTHTLYVVDGAGRVLAMDITRCSASSTTGCRGRIRSVKDKAGPSAVDVDLATDTVYAANGGPNGNGNTVSVINGATCNGRTARGCAQEQPQIVVGRSPFWIAVDQKTESVYVANNRDGTVSVINGARCNAKVRSGCHRRPRAVETGAGASFVQVDDSRHTVFALNNGDGTMSEIDTRTCRGSFTGGCPRRARNEQLSWDPPAGYNPNAFALVPHTGTVYLANVGGESFMAAASIRRCNALTRSGCRTEAPSVQEHEYLMSLDPLTDTIYAGNLNRPRIDVINGATCRVGRISGCTPIAHIPIPGADANVGSVDDATHTLYASNPFGDKVEVIDTATCNASDTSGCGHQPPTITAGPAPGPPRLDPATHTLYVPVGMKANRISVIDTSSCNAALTSGCGQAPASAPIPPGTFDLAVSVATDTVYAATNDNNRGNTVSVLNGATCNSSQHTGCGHLLPTVKVGLGPATLAVDDVTHTVYVSNNADGDLPGTVSLINEATCNGTDTAGCAAPTPSVTVGRSPRAVAIDPVSHAVYVSDFSSAAISVLDGSTCNAQHTSGCPLKARQQPVRSAPNDIAINPATHSVYTATLLGLGAVSILRAR
jgi:DNA-binding beta-propeller fold protein YncE